MKSLGFVNQVAMDGHVFWLVQKRWGLETYDLREFITPRSAKVVQYAWNLYDPERDIFILNCWRWVASNFLYPVNDMHKMQAFVDVYRTWGSYRQTDFWHLPAEMIGFYEEGQRRNRVPEGDCDDLAILLASLLLSRIDGAYANIGFAGDKAHAWVTVMRGDMECVLETTMGTDNLSDIMSRNSWIPVERMNNLVPSFKFNDKEVIPY